MKRATQTFLRKHPVLSGCSGNFNSESSYPLGCHPIITQATIRWPNSWGRRQWTSRREAKQLDFKKYASNFWRFQKWCDWGLQMWLDKKEIQAINNQWKNGLNWFHRDAAYRRDDGCVLHENRRGMGGWMHRAFVSHPEDKWMQAKCCQGTRLFNVNSRPGKRPLLRVEKQFRP